MSGERSLDQRRATAPESKLPRPRRIVDQLRDPDDLTEMLQELHVLILGVQVLTGFLLILPFSQDFRDIPLVEKCVYLAAFVCGIVSLILLSAPTAQHRLERPLRDRARFKEYATRMTIAGLIPLSLALTLTTQLIVQRALGALVASIMAACVAALPGVVWWIWPLMSLRSRR